MIIFINKYKNQKESECVKLNNTQILQNLINIFSQERVKQNELMKNHTSFKIGGPAEFFIKINTLEELKKILDFCKNNEIKLTLIGNGSNLLILDNGIKGIVIQLNFKQIQIKNVVEENDKFEIIVESGVQLGFLAQKLLKEEITGFEELSGIPGTIGGAIFMNAGAHQKEMKDIVTEVVVMDYDGNIHKFSNEEAQFEYRKSRFSKEKYIILGVKLLLEKGNKEQIREKMQEYLQYRKEKQPIEYPSAGSTFKRGNDFVTAKLIDEAGLKGYSIGDAQISEKHAGFIINKGNATSQEILDLVEYVKKEIYEKYKKKIELEIKIVGEK